MKVKKYSTFLLILIMLFSMLPTFGVSAAEADPWTGVFWDLHNTSNIQKDDLTVKVDGSDLSVTRYWGHYYDKNEPNQLTWGPGRYGPDGLRDDLQINIYVPEGATADSAVLFILNNSSWAQNPFPTNTIVNYTENTGTSTGYYSSAGEDKIGQALSRNMVIVSYGARCRGSMDVVDGAKGSEYVGHSPATIADTKAAIRFLKYNIAQGNIPADADKIFVEGHSGGGALASIIGASGNSSDYDNYLTHAAPATDDVFGAFASAPITDLPMADFAYEFTFGDYRDNTAYGSGGNAAGYLTYAKPDADLLTLSETLAQNYEDYISDLFGMDANEYNNEMKALLEASVQHEIDLAQALQYPGRDGVDLRPKDDTRGWFDLSGNDVTKGSFDLDAYLEWLVSHVNLGANASRYAGNELKGVMAFNSQGMIGGYSRNENNLWGKNTQEYSVAYKELWDIVASKAAIGIDSYNDWNSFWAAEGDLVSKQMKMTSPMPYLMGSKNIPYLTGQGTAGDKTDVAPNWFIRHGMTDIDTSAATVTSLVLAVKEAAAGQVNAYFGWERSHNGGMTYYAEFFDWLESNNWVSARVPAVSTPDSDNPFTDATSDKWFYPGVNYVYTNGLMDGTSAITFAPAANTNRAMLVTVLYRLAGNPAVSGANNFTDLSQDWYKDAVQWAVTADITSGTGETTFGPAANLTREQLAVFLYRFAQHKGYDVSKTADLSGYSDAGSISAYATDAMSWANANGLITGVTNTTLDPKGLSNRAVIATILLRFSEEFGK